MRYSLMESQFAAYTWLTAGLNGSSLGTKLPIRESSIHFPLSAKTQTWSGSGTGEMKNAALRFESFSSSRSANWDYGRGRSEFDIRMELCKSLPRRVSNTEDGCRIFVCLRYLPPQGSRSIFRERLMPTVCRGFQQFARSKLLL